MRILLTGYPGWLTVRFLETLKDYGFPFDHVRCLSQKEYFLDQTLPSGCSRVEGDLSDSASLERATEGVQIVLHAAGMIHVKKISDFYLINREGTRNLLRACVKNSVQKFIFISSNAAQGFSDRKDHVLTEADPCRPECDYGRSKFEAEKVVSEFQMSGRIQTVILRPAMFYGPPVAVRHLDIFRKISRGSFPVFGSGDFARSVTYIDNLIQAIHLAIHSQKANGQIYTIVDRVVPTLVDIIQTISESMGKNKVRIIHLPKILAVLACKFDEMISSMGIYWMLPHIVGESCRNINYSITKAEQELGYRPEIDFYEGYRRTIAWCRERNLLS